MQLPWVFREAHDLMVAALRSRISELEKERDFYRDAWARREGSPVGFREVSTGPVVPPATAGPDLHEFGADWSDDDWEAYNLWQATQRTAQPALTRDELRVRWMAQYGTTTPLVVMAE